MQYPPEHHQEANFENILSLINSSPLATIISSLDDQIEASHTPLVYKKNAELGVLIGHLDKYNPQLNHFKKDHPVELIFHGPEVYISPAVYGTTQLPTWNYFKAHIKGVLTIEKDQEKVRQSLIDMTTFLEGDSPAYTLEKDNPRMARALDYIVGFHIKITHWEGKYKISQDKRKDDRERAKNAMIDAKSKSLDQIERLYQLHHTMKS